MKRSIKYPVLGNLWALPLWALLIAQAAQACSTILLKNDSTVLVGHNLDMPAPIPGVIVKNVRGVTKRGYSFEELRSGKPSTRPILTWTAKFGSLTYNPLCRDLPDGGLNEAGLYIGEMSVEGVRFPTLAGKPRLFMAHWMQYVLDSCATVEQAIQTTREIELDGWGWHFFVADKVGNAAVIEFLDGTTRVYEGESLKIPALCNSKYAWELQRLRKYSGFGGELELKESSKDTPRFVCAASRLAKFTESKFIKPSSAPEYCFDTLKMLDRGSTQWSIACDVRTRQFHFRTAQSGNIRTLRFSDLKFSNEVEMLDIHAHLEGDVKGHLAVYTPKLNRAFASAAVHNLIKIDSDFGGSITSNGRSTEDFITALSDVCESSRQ